MPKNAWVWTGPPRPEAPDPRRAETRRDAALPRKALPAATEAEGWAAEVTEAKEREGAATAGTGGRSSEATGAETEEGWAKEMMGWARRNQNQMAGAVAVEPGLDARATSLAWIRGATSTPGS